MSIIVLFFSSTLYFPYKTIVFFNRQQLCDLIGLTQTMAAHQAAKKFLHFDSELDIDNTERYLWALSVGTHPHVSESYGRLLNNYKFFNKLLFSNPGRSYLRSDEDI